MRMAKFNRTWSGFLTLLIGLTTLSTSFADNSVHIWSNFQQRIITSSTLNWLPIDHYDASKELVIGGFQESTQNTEKSNNEADQGGQHPKRRPIYVCRVEHNGVYVAGSQLEGERRCTVTFLGIVKSYQDRYDLLENIENAARLTWVAWNKLILVPVGAVRMGTMWVARYVVTEEEKKKDGSSFNTHYIGTLDQDEDLGKITYVKDNGKEATATSGQLLVETEPISYNLTKVKFNKWRKRIFKNEPKIIGEATISNSRREYANFGETFLYPFNYSSYWGHRPEMIKALNTTISYSNGSKIAEIKWGMHEKEYREIEYTVDIHLEPGTAVNVTLKANWTDFEAPYDGVLVSHYDDGETRSREISGMRREETMVDVKPVFSPIYFLNNMSIVPTTVAPSTTIGTTATTGSSTSMSTSGITAQSSSTTTIKAASKNDVDENMVIPPRKLDNSNMVNEDGAPLSLKNKGESGAAASLLVSCLPILLSTIFISLYRVT